MGKWHVRKVLQISDTAYVHKSRGKLSSRSPPQWSAKGTHNRARLFLGIHNRCRPSFSSRTRHRCSPECAQYTFPASSLPPLKVLSLAPHKVGLKHARLSYMAFPDPFTLIVAKAFKNPSMCHRVQGIGYISRPCRLMSHTHK